MKITMKTIKKLLSTVLTIITMVALAAIIFIKGGWAPLSSAFFRELGAVLLLTLLMKFWWYDYAEERRLEENDIVQEQTNYFTILDGVVTDSNDLDKYLEILNQENKEHYVKNKIGSRTAKNLAKKNFWVCLWHPSYRKKKLEEIGEIRYAKLYFKYKRKADKLKPIKSEEIMALSDTEQLYDSKNYRTQHKRVYQAVTTIGSFILITFISSMALEQIMLNWINVFRYLWYVCSMLFTIALTIVRAYRQTGYDTLDYFSRLKYIIDKYATYKENREDGR